MSERALPKAFLDSVKPLLGASYAAFLASYEAPPQRAVRLSDRREHMAAYDLKKAVPWQKSAFFIASESVLGAHPLHWAGAYYLQDASAMTAVAALNPQPGEKVLDVCAAPGGKACQMGERMKGQGLLVANEVVPGRAKELSRNLERMGIINSVVLNESPERLAESFPLYFDRVLVDAPCSGEGMFRKNPESIGHWSPELPEMNARRQLAILNRAAKTLVPGGMLAYSTCTFNRIENEGVVGRFLQDNPIFSLCSFSLPGLPPAKEGMLRLWPHQQLGEGHFVALFQKEGERPSPGEYEAVFNQVFKSEPLHHQQMIHTVNAALPDWTENAWRATDCFQGQAVMAPLGLPSLDRLKVLRLGLHLGGLRGRTPVPDHALALAGVPRLQLPVHLSLAQAYRRGEPLACDADLAGFMAPSLQGWPLGWGKAVEGVLKNHYPKGLRTN